ncbi:MAG: hypothetical protein RL095_1620 [Verrucomicrobiota bacterium]|jgi:hemerythrin
MEHPADLDPARYRLGNALVDAEHEELIRLINRLNHPGQPVHEILERLQEYVRSHFTVEEEFMRCSGYPGREGHCRQHEEFRRHLARILDFARETPQDEQATTRMMRDYLGKWLTEHICHSDRSLVEFLARKQWS